MDSWESLSKEELDYHFSPSQFSHRFKNPDDVINAHISTLTTASAKARKVHGSEIVSLGATKEQAIEIIAPNDLPKDCPVFVYIHGGYWQHLSLEMSCFMAEAFAQAGIATIAVGYDLAPAVTMEELLTQVEKGVAKAMECATSRSSRGVYISGHSAGGHLAAMMLNSDWSTYNVDFSIVKGVFPVSGVFDLRPIVRTYVNEPLHMTNDSAWELSPLKHVARMAEVARERVVKVVYGEHDPPQFHKQSQEFTQKMKDLGCNISAKLISNTDHFDVIEKLESPNYELTKELVTLMTAKNIQ